MGSFDGIWMWVWFESWIRCAGRVKGGRGYRSENSRCTHGEIFKIQVFRVCIGHWAIVSTMGGFCDRDDSDWTVYPRENVEKVVQKESKKDLSNNRRE